MVQIHMAQVEPEVIPRVLKPLRRGFRGLAVVRPLERRPGVPEAQGVREKR